MREWFKSSRSVAGHSCVEVSWHAADCTSATDCVEAGHDGTDTLVRDSKHNGRGPELRFTADEWTAFTQGVIGGEFRNPNVKE